MRDDHPLSAPPPRRTLAVMTGTRLPGHLFGPDFTHEQVELFHDEDTGLRGAIAVHSTVLGPAMGGLGRAPYPSMDALVADALRLSRVAGRPTELGGMGDPSPATARSVFGTLQRAAEIMYGTADLSQRAVGVLGLGAVGGRLAGLLRRAGARLLVADIDDRRTADAAQRLDAEVLTAAACSRHAWIFSRRARSAE
jgi:glutamate dehydrogenase/leucine dehydrogenase